MTHKFSMRSSSALVLLLALTVSGCSYMPSWAGGEEKKKTKEVGERIAVLPVESALKPDSTLQSLAVTLPAATKNTDWAVHSGAFASDSANLAGGSFDKVTSATAGDGEAFEHTLVTLPVVGGGLVYSMDAVGNISAHNAADIGDRRWKSKGVSEEDSTFISGGGLAYDGGKLYAVSGRGLVVVLDATTGKEIWRKSLRAPFRSAPKVADGKLFATTIDNQLYALSTSNGEVMWTQRGISETTGLMNTVSPAVAGGKVVVPYSSGEIYVLSSADGKEIWSETLTGGKRLQASALFAGIGGDPVIDGEVVLAVNSGGVLSVKSLAAGQSAWELPIGSNNTPWIAGEYVFLLTSDNTLVALHKFDGHVRWSTKLASFEDEAKKKNPITWKGPVLVDSKLAVVASNGQLLLVNADDGKITATKSIPEGIYTSPVVAGGRMYLVSQDATLYELQ